MICQLCRRRIQSTPLGNNQAHYGPDGRICPASGKPTKETQ